MPSSIGGERSQTTNTSDQVSLGTRDSRVGSRLRLLQVLLDSARLSIALTWLARICAPAAAVAFSGALFGLAFSGSFGGLLYLGIVLMLIALLTTGVGLLRTATP